MMKSRILSVIIATVVFMVFTFGGSISPTFAATPAEVEIFNNNNISGVQSGPTSPTTFTIDSAYVITNVVDYHYFNNGILPGTISLKHSDGTVYGPWQTAGLLGQGGVQNAYWNVSPNVTIKAGTYTVIDSDSKTWSHNSGSDFKGFSIIKGYPTTTIGSQDLGTYSWEGNWTSNWGDMVIVQQGNHITGTYTHDKGKIDCIVSGNKVIGTWSEFPSYAPPRDAGDMELTMASDGKSFIGKWRYGSTGSWSNWDGGKRTSEVIPAPTTSVAVSGNSSESFESGNRLSWGPVTSIGYRMFRSTSKDSLGISVTDFYLTSTSYADVNVEPNTTYYYTIKPVLAEANPYQGIEEKLGDTIATFTITTNGTIYKPGNFKNFIMLKLGDPNLSKNGVSEEIDPGRGTTPIILSGRTMVPIRAVVEAMGGTVGWDGNTQKITLTARGNTVEMWLNKKEIIINGKSTVMDVAPVSKNGRTFVPVRFSAENLNCKVDWINSTKEAIIIFED